MENYPDGRGHVTSPALALHPFKYDRLVRLYQDVFGPENVLTLPFEMISVNPQDFIKRICQFSNIDVPENLPFHIKTNERAQYFSYVVIRRIVPFVRSSRGNAYSPSLFGIDLGRAVHRRMVGGISKIVPRSLDNWTRERLRRQIEEITGDTYAASNRATEKLIGMDLGAFGYLV